MVSNPPSGASTPNPRFKSQTKTVEDVLATQTVGLVALSDFRKRRAEALEQQERDAQDAALGLAGTGSGTATPIGNGDGDYIATEAAKKKKRKAGGPPKLSFGIDDEEAEVGGDSGASGLASRIHSKPASRSQTSSPAPGKVSKIAANTAVGLVPKVQTKRALLVESQTRETLRKEFLVLQERVKAGEVAIPFVFYDGSNIPGGVCRVKKGDFVWVFLDGSRKVGAGLGAGGKDEGAKARREWARVGVDDLMLVRGEIIIPHHYDFYYFIMNRTLGPNKHLLFDYTSQPPPALPEQSESTDLSNYNPLSVPSSKSIASMTTDVTDLEGASDDPTFTKVVDRRWYERNKHIYPASVWQEFDPEKDYQKEVKRDVGGNAFFFS